MIDLKKTYKTRDGRPVRLISDQGHPDRPIVGYVEGDPTPLTWPETGFYQQVHAGSTPLRQCLDLIEVPPEPRKIKVSGWVNVDADGNTSIFKCREDANRLSYSDRIACKYVEFEVEEGEGLWLGCLNPEYLKISDDWNTREECRQIEDAND